MAPVRAAMLLSLLALTAGVSAEDSSPAGQLARLLGPAMEAAVTRALSSWQPPALSDLTRLQARLDAVDRDLADLKLTSLAGGRYLQWAPPAAHQQSQPQTKPEPKCDRNPSPLAARAAPHQEPAPAARACARSCLQLRDQGGSPQDGVYWLTGLLVPVLCDFSHDDGGWTLLLTAVSKPGWDLLSVFGRSQRSPSLTDNYSILRHADAIRNLGSGDRFAYRIETQAEKGRRQWGGIWLAPRRYSFVHEQPSQTEVSVVRKFNNWSYNNNGIEKRMPWLNTVSGQPAVLTTSASPGSSWWGTLVTYETHVTSFDHSPWIHPVSQRSGTVLYWIREEIM